MCQRLRPEETVRLQRLLGFYLMQKFSCPDSKAGFIGATRELGQCLMRELAHVLIGMFD